jgi:hypothetical protein
MPHTTAGLLGHLRDRAFLDMAMLVPQLLFQEV